MKSVCVYCGSNAGARPIYAERAAQLGTRIAREGLALVYGGGNVGLMGLVADAALEAGGEVIGVIPEQLVGWEVAHRGVTRLEIVANMVLAQLDGADQLAVAGGGLERDDALRTATLARVVRRGGALAVAAFAGGQDVAIAFHHDQAAHLVAFGQAHDRQV